MILDCIPFRRDKNLAKGYNDIMQMLTDEDSALFRDADTMYLTPDYGNIIEDYSLRYPDAVLTCRTNRIHRLSKQLDGTMDEECDIRALIQKAEKIKHLRTVTEIKPLEGMSGFLMLVPKRIWKKVPFIENGGCLGVDSKFRIDLHAAGIKIYIMDGLFVFHQYRLLHNSITHLV